MLPANYRPIGLNNTMGKLWTAMVSSVMSSYAESMEILSPAQQGFRVQRSTHQALNSLVHAIEDAAIYKQDLYVSYYDFSSAFNMVDHDKLLCIMYDLGFTEDTIDAVKSIYDGATTHISLKGGEGPAIEIGKGTIQGDTLSPLLFIIFVEPLIRWLHAGGRGYRHGCMKTDAEKDQHMISESAFADDLTALTHTVQDMQIQCSKVHHFSTWAGLPLNYTKCEVTGILHATNPSDPTSKTHVEGLLKNKIAIGEAYAKYTPPTEPCRSLGVLITLNMDWKPQVEHMAGIIQTKGEQLLYRAKPAGATPRQLLHLIQTCIKPAVAYTMSVAPYTAKDIARFDRLIASIAKRCCNLSASLPNAAIHLPVEEAGMGITSLRVEYLQITTATITRGLNNKGKLGATTLALLNKQCETLGDLPPDSIPREATRYSTVARQFHMLTEVGTRMGKGEEYLTPKGCKGLTRLNEAHTGDLIPPVLWHHLRTLGITSHEALITAAGKHLINTTDMANMWGSKVKPVHKRALNRISIILTGNKPTGYTGAAMRYKDLGPLPLANRELPTHMHAGSNRQTAKNVKDLMGQTRAPAEGNNTPRETQQTPSNEAPTHKKAKTTQAWWKCTSAPTISQARASEDTPEKWQAMLHLCVNQRGTAFFKHHKLNKDSTGQDLRTALHSKAENSPPPPQKVLHMLYATQYKATQFTSYESRHTERGVCRTWGTQWAPVTLLTHHVGAFTQLGFQVKSTTPTPDTVDYTTVEWMPTKINEKRLKTMLGHTCKELETQFNQQEPEKAPPPPRRDMHLTNAQQQGTWKTAGDFDSSTVKTIRDHVHIDPMDMHPDWDIKPTGKYEIQVGIQGPEHENPVNTDTAYIYSPEGRTVGTIPAHRMKVLHHMYEACRARHPELHTKLEAGYFASDVAALIFRYRAGEGGKEKHAPNPTLHPDLMKAISKLGITQERFASPLDHSIHIPTYWSQYEQDQLFGAQWNAYTRPWDGTSVAHPEHEARGMNKAVRWAIASAVQAELPEHANNTCTIFILPEIRDSAYTALLTHPTVTIIDTIPAGHQQYADGAAWMGGKHQEHKSKKTATIIFAVTNAGGQEHLSNNAASFLAAWNAAKQATRGRMGTYTPLRSINAPKNKKAPTMVKASRNLQPLLQKMGKQAEPRGYERMQTNSAIFPCTTSILPKNGVQLYTDGSSMKGADGSSCIGAGVYNATTGECTRINPGGRGSSYTNNRAELVAALVAMEGHPAETDLTIYTDSLCSIQNIRKMLDKPHLMQESKHRELVEKLVQTLAQRAMAGGHTYLKKVRSHTGIHGNDEADRLAKEATDSNMPIDTHITVGEEAHAGMMWPSLREEIPAEGATPGPPAHRWRQASNLTADIKNKAPTTHSTGYSNLDGIYASNWKETTPTLHKASSSGYWKSHNTTWWERRTIMQLRWGHFFTMKLAFRWHASYAGKPATSAFCPLCKCCIDGASHILAGCKEFKGFYINRHNKAVRIFQVAASKHAQGNCYMVMDAGKQDELPDTVHAQRLPDSLRPPQVTQEEWRKLRPDLVVITGMTANETPTHGMKLHMEMLEVGYCSDTNHAVKIQDKQEQHARLLHILREAGHTVRYHPITLGTTGTIRKETLSTLQQLGLTLPQAQKTMNKLHQNAIASAVDITRARRIRERQTGSDPP